MKLFLQALTKYVFGVLLVGALIFAPAGTLRYPKGWCLMGILFVPMFLAGLIMLFYPLLLVKRIRNEEKVLEKGLDGYRSYEEKVRYRLLPLIW